MTTNRVRMTVAQLKELAAELEKNPPKDGEFTLDEYQSSGPGIVRAQFQNNNGDHKQVDMWDHNVSKRPTEIKKFDIVSITGSSLCIVLSDPIEVPYFEDGVASQFSKVPLDIQNPDEWKKTFTAVILFDLITNDYKIHAIHNISYKYDGEITEGYIPFDNGTGDLRRVLGLIKLADKWYGHEGKPFLPDLTKL